MVEPSQPFVYGRHLGVICEHLEAVSRQEIADLLINVPPGHMKSLLTSVFWMPWVWISDPASRWLHASYAATLSLRDSVKCRRLIQSDWYQRRWGDVVKLTGDQNAKERWENVKTGVRIATSVGGSGTGEGGNYLVIDDPINADEAMSSTALQTAKDWYSNTWATRQRPPGTGGRVIVMQRLSEDDLSGYVLGLGGWTHLCLPARYEREHPHRCKVDWRKREGELLWPEMFDKGRQDKVERELASDYKIAGQMQQRPEPKGGGIIKPEWWRLWPSMDEEGQPVEQPHYEYIIHSWDTAFSEKAAADQSALTIWGIFWPTKPRPERPARYHESTEPEPQPRAMLLWAEARRVGFPDLLDWVQMEASSEDLPPNLLVVEDKASGQSLIQALRKEGVTVYGHNPGRASKSQRADLVSHLWASGRVWVPQGDHDPKSPRLKAPGLATVERHCPNWAYPVIRQCSRLRPEMSDSELVDLADSAVQAVTVLRDRNWLSLSRERERYPRRVGARFKENPYGA